MYFLLINLFEFHDTLKRIFNHIVLNGTGFFIRLVTRSKHVKIILVVLKLHVKIFNDLVCMLYFFMVSFNFNIHFFSDLYKLFYFRKILSPRRSLWEKFLEFEIFTLNSGHLLLMEFFHLVEFFVHILGMLQSVFLNLINFFMCLLLCFFNIYLTFLQELLLLGFQLKFFLIDFLLNNLLDSSLFSLIMLNF